MKHGPRSPGISKLTAVAAPVPNDCVMVSGMQLSAPTVVLIPICILLSIGCAPPIMRDMAAQETFVSVVILPTAVTN